MQAPVVSKADIGTFATLNNLKVVVPQPSSDMLLLSKSFAASLMEKLIATIYVDEKWYRERYPDIVPHLDQGLLRSSKEHFTKFGYFEHRMPYYIEVREDWYLTEYPDVRAAVRRETIASAQVHFEELGFREGRFPFPNFALLRG